MQLLIPTWDTFFWRQSPQLLLCTVHGDAERLCHTIDSFTRYKYCNGIVVLSKFSSQAASNIVISTKFHQNENIFVSLRTMGINVTIFLFQCTWYLFEPCSWIWSILLLFCHHWIIEPIRDLFTNAHISWNFIVYHSLHFKRPQLPLNRSMKLWSLQTCCSKGINIHLRLTPISRVYRSTSCIFCHLNTGPTGRFL